MNAATKKVAGAPVYVWALVGVLGIFLYRRHVAAAAAVPQIVDGQPTTSVQPGSFDNPQPQMSNGLIYYPPTMGDPTQTGGSPVDPSGPPVSIGDGPPIRKSPPYDLTHFPHRGSDGLVFSPGGGDSGGPILGPPVSGGGRSK